MGNETVQFLGAAGTVTGSKHLVATSDHQVLLDCGLFQGLKALRLRNWDPPPLDVQRLDAVVLSHAHIDHTGYLPVLVKSGYQGPVYCTPATADLLNDMLRDSAYLQEEQAHHANKYGYSKHRPALPLYTMVDAEAAIKLLEPRDYHDAFPVTSDISVTFRYSGHIMGSATVSLRIDGKDPKTLVFSGDLGRWDRPILKDPEPVLQADVLLLESTYGNRSHADIPEDQLARVVREAAARGGALIIPAFALGRTQEILWRLRQLEDAGAIPVLPVYMDSPLAIRVTGIYKRHKEEHDLEMAELMDDNGSALETRRFELARTPDESKALHHLNGPVIIISASGMATGGRVLHHLKRRLPERRTTVLLVGYQAAGTRGRLLQDGAKEVRIHGQEITVRAHIETLDGLSAHADREEILRWLASFEQPPQDTYLVHGEEHAAAALAELIKEHRGWTVRPARDNERVVIRKNA
jgi:metallo-beta-lactamase family protein